MTEVTELSEYQTLLRDAYRGEFFGEGFFASLAERQPDPDRREKLETLTTIEARTAQSLKRLASAAGVLGNEKTELANGRALADGIEPEQWDSFCQGLVDTLPAFLANFERLVEVASTPTDPALRALVNHEKAIQRFAELEVAGESKKSLKPLVDHLRKPA